MQRQFAVQTLWIGLAAGSLCSFAQGQSQAPAGVQPGVVQLGGARTAPGYAQPSGGSIPQGVGGSASPGASTGQQPRPQVQLQADPRVDAVLIAWEKHTRSVERLHGNFERYVYDGTFAVEKRAIGEFWYEAPDKARLDFHPFPENRLPPPNEQGQRLNPSKRASNNMPYTVLQDSATKWVCRGDALLFIYEDEKCYDLAEIPPAQQGKNIAASPLPFLFGMSAEDMKRRFYVGLGAMHDPEGLLPGPDGKPSGRRQIHLVATPRQAALAQEFKRAEVLLDPGTTLRDSAGQPVFVPFAIKLLDPTGQTETVYSFNVASTKLNEWRLFARDPFKNPSLWQGYKLRDHRRLAFDEEPEQRTAEAPVGAPAQAAPFQTR